MKTHFQSSLTGVQSSPAEHKTVQGRSQSAKTSSHRYERRKVRELLRHGGGVDSNSSLDQNF